MRGVVVTYTPAPLGRKFSGKLPTDCELFFFFFSDVLWWLVPSRLQRRCEHTYLHTTIDRPWVPLIGPGYTYHWYALRWTISIMCSFPWSTENCLWLSSLCCRCSRHTSLVFKLNRRRETGRPYRRLLWRRSAVFLCRYTRGVACIGGVFYF